MQQWLTVSKLHNLLIIKFSIYESLEISQAWQWARREVTVSHPPPSTVCKTVQNLVTSKADATQMQTRSCPSLSETSFWHQIPKYHIYFRIFYESCFQLLSWCFFLLLLFLDPIILMIFQSVLQLIYGLHLIFHIYHSTYFLILQLLMTKSGQLS